MFFLKELQKELLLHPMHFGPNLHHVIRLRLMEEVSGISLGKHGYVVTVTRIRDEDIGKGIIEESGYVCFNVRYQAILFRPFKNEVMDGVVTAVTQLGLFVEVGPLQVFVSRHGMGPDLQEGYDPRSDSWISDDKQVEIKRGSAIRLKIMGISIDATEISAIGTIKEDYLGLISSDVY